MTSDPPQRRRWFQFRLRTLLIAVLVLSVPLSWFAARMERARWQREAVEKIERRGGCVSYDSGIESWMRLKPNPTWVRGLLGSDFFDTVISVHLWGSRISDVKQLRRLTGLKSLSLPHTDITDAGLAQLESMANLEELGLAGTHVTDAGLVHLRGLTNLKVLYLRDTSVTDAGLVHLRGLTNLRVLDFHDTQVTDAGLLNLTGLTNLEKLDLSFAHVTDDGLEHLKALSGLHVLDLDSTQVTDAGLVHLKELTSLRYLQLGGTSVTVGGVDELVQTLPNCEIEYEFLRPTQYPPWDLF